MEIHLAFKTALLLIYKYIANKDVFIIIYQYYEHYSEHKSKP